MKKIIIFLMFLCLTSQAFSFEEKFYTLTGASVSYTKDIACGNTVLFLWTSRCPYCMRELKEMNKNEDIGKYANFYFVNLGESQSDVERVVKSLNLKTHISSKIILDKDLVMAQEFSIIGVPTFIFMRDGKTIDRNYYFDEHILEEIFKK